jgi:hypothetical protein
MIGTEFSFHVTPKIMLLIACTVVLVCGPHSYHPLYTKQKSTSFTQIHDHKTFQASTLVLLLEVLMPTITITDDEEFNFFYLFIFTFHKSYREYTVSCRCGDHLSYSHHKNTVCHPIGYIFVIQI